MTLFGLDPVQIGGFLAAAIAVTLAPGPDNLMILSQGLARGRRAGLAFGLGCAVGCLFHTALAAVGVGALVAASPGAFLALRIVGGIYLIWLGIGAWRSQGGQAAVLAPDERAAAPWRLFGRGLVANAINPKVVLFSSPSCRNSSSRVRAGPRRSRWRRWEGCSPFRPWCCSG